jgi:hypothetical protein
MNEEKAKFEGHMHVLPENADTNFRLKQKYISVVKKVADVALKKRMHTIIFTDMNHTESFNLLKQNPKQENSYLFDDAYQRDIRGNKVILTKANESLSIYNGEEIQTKQGDILAWGINKLIKPHKGLDETIEEIFDNGGRVIVPHPMTPTIWGITGGIGYKNLCQTYEKYGDKILIEVLNGQLAGPANYFNIQANSIADKIGAKKVGGSDARCFMSNQYNRVGEVCNEIDKYILDKGINYLSEGEIKIKGKVNSLKDTLIKTVLPVLTGLK